MKNVFMMGKWGNEKIREKRKVRWRQRLAGGHVDGLFVRGDGAKTGDFTFVFWAGTGTTVGGDARGPDKGVVGGGIASDRVAGGATSCQWVDKKIWEKKKERMGKIFGLHLCLG